MNKNQVIAVFAVAAMLFLTVAPMAITDDSDAASTKGTLIVETSPDFAPFEYTVGKEFAGIDMDIVRAVCKDMGYDVEFRINSFDSILMSVQQGKCDIGASGFSINDERKAKVLFSEPYADIHQVLVTPIDSTIDSADDVKGKKTSVQLGTTGASYAETLKGDVIFQKTYADVINDLLSGKAECEVVDNTVAIAQVSAHPDKLKVVDVLHDSPIENYGFIFSKKNAALADEFNRSLNNIMESGLYNRIMNYYEFNGYSPDTPPFVDTADHHLVVETSPDFAPFDYTVGKVYAGIDMDIVRGVCKDMGWTVEFRTNSFDSIILSVQQGKCDMGASGFSINEERKKQVLFSDPYADIHQVLVVPIDSTIDSAEDVAGKKVSVQLGTTGAAYAEVLGGNVIFQKTYADVINDLINKKAQCEVVDSTVAVAQVSAHPDKLKVVDVLYQSPVEDYGFIFSKENAELATLFNQSFRHLKDSGEYAIIMDYYKSHGYSPDTPSYYEKLGTLSVGTYPYLAPYEYKYKDEYAGLDVDYIRTIADSVNYNVKFETKTLNEIFEDVKNGKCDIGVSALAIDDALKDQVLFSDPYMEGHQVLLVKSGSVFTIDDLSTLRIAVQNGTASKVCAEKYATADKIVGKETADNAALALISGDADCMIVDSIAAKAIIAKNTGLSVLENVLAEEPAVQYGFIFNKDTGAEYCELMNGAIAALKTDGSLKAIDDYYAKHDYKEIPSIYSSENIDTDTDEGSKGFWDNLKDTFYTDFIKNDRYTYVFEGLKNTLIISVIALIVGMLLGTVVAIIRSVHDQTGKLRLLNSIGVLYTTVIRGTPVMVQLMLIYYVVFASSTLDSVMVASVAFGLNSGAYVAESVRAGINAVPKGQMEAARSLGMSNTLAMITVILPQAIRNILPALGNEGISLLKETSVAGYIGVMDLTKGVDIIRGQTYDALLPMLVAAMIYLAIVLVLAKLIKIMEKRLNNAY